MLKEIWKDIEGWEGYYKISSLGRVLSVKRGIYKILDENSGGYLRVQLCNNDKKQRPFVHRLVAKAFVDGYFEGADVNHKDFDRHNNTAENLEWVTKSQNSKWTFNAGRMTGSFKDKPYKLVFSDGNEIIFANIKECAKSIGFCKNSLYNYIKNKNGYIKTLNCHILPCVSNDYPEREYTQASGNGNNSESY